MPSLRKGQLRIGNKIYTRVETPTTIRIAGKTYVLAQMTAEEVEKLTLDMSMDSSALALVFQENGLKEQADQARQIATLFSDWSDNAANFV